MEYRGSKSNNHARIGVKYCAAGFRNLFAGEFQPAPSAMRESGDRNVNTMNGWRRERDSNPRYGVNPYNALAGRPLRPLGHLSGRAAHYITRVRASFPCQPGWSSPNALCSARTASSMYFSSITTEILISEVEIIWMLMPSSARVRNILLAMPAWVRMPTPTMDTLQILSC